MIKNQMVLTSVPSWGTPFILICCLLFAALAYIVFIYLNKGKIVLSNGLLTTNTNLKKKLSFKQIFIIIFSFAVIIKILFAASYSGYQDITYFRYWVNELLSLSPANFYDNLPTNSYLPGYLYILYLLGGIIKLFNISIMSDGFLLLLKIPSVLCDCFCAYLIYKIAKKYTKKEFAFAFCLLYLFNPATFINSSFWGQVDAFTALFTILSISFMLEKKFYRAFAFLAVGMTFKLQIIFILPVLGIFVLMEIYEYIKTKDTKKILTVFYGILICIGTFTAICLPFMLRHMIEGKIFYIFNIYFGQVDNFNYFALNAFNFYSMIIKNWAEIPASPILGFLSWNMLNYIIIALISIAVMTAYIIGRNKKNIFLLSAYIILFIFTFSMKIHERYMFAAMAPLLLAAVINKDKRLFLSYIVFSLLQFINVGVLLFKEPIVRYYLPDDKFLIIFSNIWVFYFLYFTYVVIDIMLRKRPKIAPVEAMAENTQIKINNIESEIIINNNIDYKKEIIADENILQQSDKDIGYKDLIDKKVKEFDDKYKKSLDNNKKSAIKKKDYIIMTAFALIYFLINMINLGGTNVPQSYWEVIADGGNAEYIVLEIPDGVKVSEIWGYKGIDAYESTSNAVKVYAANTVNEADYSDIIKTANYMGQRTVSNNGGDSSAQMYKWFNMLTLKETYKYIAFSCDDTGVRINEIVLLEKDTREIIRYNIIYSSVQGVNTVANAFDESTTYPGYNSLMTDMYFDEIYHARTAFEQINGWVPYEITHPPLGKILIGIGIRIFGMNPFGWRIMGVLFAALLLPVIYIIGKKLFKKTKWAVLFTLLMSVEGLHFVQGRIATIDTYIVFFSSLSMLFMIMFFKTNILRDNIFKCLVPFALSGIFFGMAVASKWTGLYTGAGLFVILIIYVFRILDEYRYNAAALQNDITAFKAYSNKLNDKLKYILITGVIFFILVPFAVYLLSYLPYMISGNDALNVLTEKRSLLQVMIDNQVYMYNYHSKWVVDATHQCESSWYSWLINWKSVYFYNADSSFGNNMYARIHSIGNPIISWAGVTAFIYCLFYIPFRKPLINAVNNINMAEKDEYITEMQCGSKKILSEEQLIKKYKIRDLPENLSGSSKDTLILLAAGFLAALLPWVFVERSTFIYHFYPAMPYYIGMIIFLLIKICKKYDKIILCIKFWKIELNITKGGLITGIYISLAVIIFAMFFPVFTGIPVSKNLANFLFLWLRLFTGSVGF